MVRASDMPELGTRIRAYREQSNISVRELARRVGLSASAISKIELGKAQPTLNTLCALVAALGISFDELFSSVRSTR
jgi:transcriptional regulator with XRE-family HTH domain